MEEKRPLLADKREWLPVLSLLAATLLWASSFVALKIAFAHFDPMVVIFGRMLVGSLCFIFLPATFRGLNYRPGDLGRLGLMAFCEPCLYFIFEAMAIVNTTASQAGMVTAILPLLVAVVARIALKEHLTRRTLAGFFIAIAGVIWLSLAAEADAGAPNPLLGNFYEFVAMVCATGYVIQLKRLTSRYSPFFLTAVQAFAGSLFFFPILFLPGTELPVRYDFVGVTAVVYLGAFITLGAYGCYNYGVSRIPVSQATAFINLIPVFAVILGWMVLGETFTGSQYLAAGIVFWGVYLSQDRRRPSKT
jgi:drug/metabolite transporter (DMT)-like permease